MCIRDRLIILLGIISIIDFSTKKIPVVVLVVMGIVGIASSFYAKQSIISVSYTHLDVYKRQAVQAGGCQKTKGKTK